MERVSELQMQKCMKRRELLAARDDGGDATQVQREDAVTRERSEELQQRPPWREIIRPFGRPAWPQDCGGGDDPTMRALKSYCRDRNLPDDMYRPVRAGQCDGGGKFRLSDLVDELHRVFTEDRVNVEYVQYLMKSYCSDPAEWLKYAKFNKFRYTRNLVDAGNDKFNLMVLCWGEGHGSSIHDHPNSECVMKVLAGQLTEVRFAWPKRETSNDDDGDDDEMQPMYETSRTVLETNGICHINDEMGLHRVENASHTDKAVSLHLYCPPFEECSTFNQQTGHKTKAKSTFWSIYGEKVSKKRVEERVPDDN